MLIGHQLLYSRLKSLAQNGELRSTQLFLGPAQVGKTHMALLLSVLLQGATDDVLFKKQILEGTHADTVLLLDKGENLSIEEVRHIIERSHQSHSSPYLIFVLENLGRLRPEAANALLKTLEEPGEGVLFFLTAHREGDVLPTIRSRSSVHTFQTVPEAELRELCKGHSFEKELLFFAMGRPGKLQRLLNEPEYFSAHQTMLQDVLHFLEAPSIPMVFELVRRYEKDPLLLEMLDILLQRTRTWALNGRLPVQDLCRAEEAKQQVQHNVNTKLVLENLLLPFVP